MDNSVRSFVAHYVPHLTVMHRNKVLLVASGILAAFSPYAHKDTVLTNLSTGYAVSVFFYFLVVRIPEKRKNRRLIANFERQYEILKRDCLVVILGISERCLDSEQIEKLTSPKEFSEYAKPEKWYDFLNGVESGHIDEFKHHIRVFREELQMLLSSIDVADDKLFERFKNISIWSAQMELRTDDYDDVKSWGRFLYELLADWSPIDGKHEKGIVGELIHELKLKA